MRNYGPMFAHLFGLHPWDLQRLTVEQWEAFKFYADSMKGDG